MKNNTKYRIEQILKFTWLAAALVLMGMAVYYTTEIGAKASAKFYILSAISFLFFIRRHYFSK